jgi:hypothetical protein
VYAPTEKLAAKFSFIGAVDFCLKISLN